MIIELLKNFISFWKRYFDFDYSEAILIGAGIFLLLAFFMWRVRKSQGTRMAVREWICILIFSVYLTFLFGVTLFNRQSEGVRQLQLELLWSYKMTLLDRNWALGLQIIFNVIAFLPFGFLVPELFHRMQRFMCVIIAACLLSGFIEGIQLVFSCGLCELDDVMNNTIGAGIGYIVWWGCRKNESH